MVWIISNTTKYENFLFIYLFIFKIIFIDMEKRTKNLNI